MGCLHLDRDLETTRKNIYRMPVLLPLLLLATGMSCYPHGYQYQLPKEYNSYSPSQGGSYPQLEPFRRFLQKYMASSKTSQDNHPYRYMSHPMANVPVSNIRSEVAKPSLYHHKHDTQNKDLNQYMVGELFFKDHDRNIDHEEDNDDEKRHYPSLTFICNKTKIDTAADPLAGLERMNPYDVMMSRRYQKTPKSQMFRELFKYIQGENQNKEEIEMTRPVVTFHNVTKETTQGNYEEQEMCFYLPSKYQKNHKHEEEDHEQTEEEQQDKATSRHAVVSPPEPVQNGRVYLYTRPAMQVYVRTFGGFALTHQTWEEQREILEEDILGKKYNPSEYFTAQYDNPWKLTNKRNEVWIQCLQPFETLPASVVGDKTRKAPKSN